MKIISKKLTEKTNNVIFIFSLIIGGAIFFVDLTTNGFGLMSILPSLKDTLGVQLHIILSFILAFVISSLTLILSIKLRQKRNEAESMFFLPFILVVLYAISLSLTGIGSLYASLSSDTTQSRYLTANIDKVLHNAKKEINLLNIQKEKVRKEQKIELFELCMSIEQGASADLLKIKGYNKQDCLVGDKGFGIGRRYKEYAFTVSTLNERFINPITQVTQDIVNTKDMITTNYLNQYIKGDIPKKEISKWIEALIILMKKGMEELPETDSSLSSPNIKDVFPDKSEIALDILKGYFTNFNESKKNMEFFTTALCTIVIMIGQFFTSLILVPQQAVNRYFNFTQKVLETLKPKTKSIQKQEVLEFLDKVLNNVIPIQQDDQELLNEKFNFKRLKGKYSRFLKIEDKELFTHCLNGVFMEYEFLYLLNYASEDTYLKAYLVHKDFEFFVSKIMAEIELIEDEPTSNDDTNSKGQKKKRKSNVVNKLFEDAELYNKEPSLN